MSKKTFKCPFCHKSYLEKQGLYNHIDKKHSEYVSEEFPPSRLYFNFVNKKTVGHCVICGKETEWNNSTERYNRFCSEKCKDKYVKEFQKRMIKVHGMTTQQMLSDPEMQKKMLSNRKISGKYKWSDGSAEIQYTGSYELDFLKFLDLFMNFESADVISPAPQTFYYNDNGNKRFYIPDFYIPSINTLVEIKDGGENKNNHPNRIEIDGRKEALKDEIMRNQKEYNFVKVLDKDYSIFLNFLMKLKENSGDVEEKKEKFSPVIDIQEAFNMAKCAIKQEILNEQKSLLQENNVNISSLTYYHAELVRKDFKRDIQHCWDEELYYKTLELAVTHPDGGSIEGLNEYSVYVYTMAEEYRTVYLGIVKVYKTSDVHINFEWEEQTPLSDSELKRLDNIQRKFNEDTNLLSEGKNNTSNYTYEKLTTNKDVKLFQKSMKRVFNEECNDDKTIKGMKMIKYNNEIIGYIGFSYYNIDNKKYLGFGNFMILPEYQNLGHGTKVLNDIIEKNKSNYDEIYCYVNKNNTKAVNFYNKIVRIDTKRINDEGYYYVYIYKKGRTNLLKEDTLVNKDIKLYHISEENLDGKILNPRVPNNYFTQNNYEDSKTKRVCFSTNIGRCLSALSQKHPNKEFYVHIPDPSKKYKIFKPTKEEVPDVSITNEYWIKEPVKLKCIGKILCIGDAGKDGMEYTYGDNKKAELYDWDWKWVDKYNN